MVYVIVMLGDFKCCCFFVLVGLICVGFVLSVLVEVEMLFVCNDKVGGSLLREVVVLVMWIEQDIYDVVNIIIIFFDECIEWEQLVDIKDLLCYEVGVLVCFELNWVFGVFCVIGCSGNEGINICGFEGNQVLLQVDGVCLFVSYLSGFYLVGCGDYIDVEVYKCVEILCGLLFIQFGSDGLVGVVSFLIKDLIDLLMLGKLLQVVFKFGYFLVDDSWMIVFFFVYVGDIVEVMLLVSIWCGYESDNMGDNDVFNVICMMFNLQDM